MASSATSSGLYKAAYDQFYKEASDHYRDPKDQEMLRDFMKQRATSAEDAKEAAEGLRVDSGKKYGNRKVGETVIKTTWIANILENIGTFVEIGNHAMSGAPESVGLAWFAVKLTLSAIQSNYDLYTYFGTGLTDITEVMIIIPHYERLYDERAKSGWKPSPLIEKLFKDIITTYVAILAFSFSVKRHLTAGTLARLRHGFKDFFGASKAKFQSRIDAISELKKKVLDESQAAFQDKSLYQLEAVQNVVADIRDTVGSIQGFQATLEKWHEDQSAQLDALLKKVEDIKFSTKAKTPWDLAFQEFEKNRDALSPMRETSGALGAAVDQKFPGTCQWVFDHSKYSAWKQSKGNSMLCITGQQGSGKSIILASLVDQLGIEAEAEELAVLYLSCERSGGASKSAPNVNSVCNTLLYQLYARAAEDDKNVILLEKCNKIFRNPKSQLATGAISRHTRGDTPEFSEALARIAAQLNIGVIVALDAVDSLSREDQDEFSRRLKSLMASTHLSESEDQIRVLVCCRSSTKFSNEILSIESADDIDVGGLNRDDIDKKLTEDLKGVSGLSAAEKEEAKRAILEKAGPSFSYVNEIAIPFIREPFQRPLSNRLKDLPGGMSDTYSEALRRMSPNYVDLLRTALKFSLLARIPPKVEEVMDYFHATYRTRATEIAPATETQEEEKPGFPTASSLDLEQLQDASGPFLRLRRDEQFGSYYVVLQDPPQIKEFCVDGAGTGNSDHHHDGELCARCQSALTQAKTLSIVPKEHHLEIATNMLRHLNNPVFQRRAGILDPAAPDSKAAEKEGEPTQEPDQSSGATAAEEEDKSGQEPGQSGRANATAADASTKNEPQGNVEDAKPEDDDKKDDDSGHDTDDSLDDEDRDENNLLGGESSESANNPPTDWANVPRKVRYEALCWPYHIREAEALWAPEERAASDSWKALWAEVDQFVYGTPEVFNKWQVLDDMLGEPFKPVHLAAYVGVRSLVQHFLDRGEDLNELCGSWKVNALQVTALSGRWPATFRFLLELGCDVMAENDKVLPAFHNWLLGDPSLENTRIMLEHGADPLAAAKMDGWTALHNFAWVGQDVEVLDLLLNHGARRPDINAVDNDGRTPLHYLLWRQKVPDGLVEAFLERGANPNAEDTTSVRPLQMTCIWGELEAVRLLSSRVEDIDDPDKDGNTALHQVAQGGHTDCARVLAEAGANVNPANRYGRAPLHSAAWFGFTNCTQVLLEHGAEPNIADKHNRTPLLFACLGESAETAGLILDVLLERKLPAAEINKPTMRGRTPLRQAASHGFEDIVERILKTAEAAGDLVGLAIDEKDARKGMTALHRAALRGHAKCVRLLLGAGADVTVRDKEARTALMLAYERWALGSEQPAYEDIISQLVNGDAAAAAADAELVATCAANGSTRLLRQLRGLGADLNRQDRYGWTPLDLARKFQQLGAEDFLKQQAAWAGMLPSRWAADPRTTVSEDGLMVTHAAEQPLSTSTDKPLPAGLERYYFEVTVREKEGVPHDEWPVVAVGFCTLGGPAIRFPGWAPRQEAPSARSWAYHGDDGGLFRSSVDGPPQEHGAPYKPGDTVGCGVDLGSHEMWFTLNGKKLDFTFANVQGRLFPLVGLCNEVELEANFAGPFKWKEGEAAMEQSVKGQSVRGQSVKDDL